MTTWKPTAGLLGVIVATAASALTAAAPTTAQMSAAPAPSPVRQVLFVGNNWDGTADVVTPTPPLRRLGRVNVIPDKEQRMAEIQTSPDKLAYFLAIRELIGEGHDQFVDDMYTTRDGRLLVVSRPSFADVVGIDIATDEVVWRFPVDGYRSDRLPANLLQAQRDYFGAHTYERIDRPRGQFFHTNWTGRGGTTSSTSYNA